MLWLMFFRLNISVDEAKFPAMVSHCGIDYMRDQATAVGMFGGFFESGPSNFFNKGVNGRWRDVLSDEEIARCDAVAARRLTPEELFAPETHELSLH